MKIFFANKNMKFIEWKYFYQILLLFGNHKRRPWERGCSHKCQCEVTSYIGDFQYSPSARPHIGTTLRDQKFP